MTEEEKSGPPTFREELTALINKHSVENGSNTPDFVLSSYLYGALSAFDKATLQRDEHYGRNHND